MILLERELLDYIKQNYLLTREKVAAIRYVMKATGVGLPECKAALDKVFKDYETTGRVADSYVLGGNATLQPTDVRAVEAYILRTYTKNDLIKAIKYYREATGVGLAEAKTAVENLFNGAGVRAPEMAATGAAFTGKSVDNSAMLRLKIRMVVFLVIGLLVLTFGLVLRLSAPSRVDELLNTDEIKTVSEAKREKLLENGYTEVFLKGGSVERDFMFNSDGHLYIFKTEDMGVYFGIVSEKSQWLKDRNCEGFHIFYQGPLKAEEVEVNEEIYPTVYTEEENVQVFDWPGETFERVREEAVKRQQDVAAIVAIPGAFSILVSLVCFLLVNKKK